MEISGRRFFFGATLSGSKPKGQNFQKDGIHMRNLANKKERKKRQITETLLEFGLFDLPGLATNFKGDFRVCFTPRGLVPMASVIQVFTAFAKPKTLANSLVA